MGNQISSDQKNQILFFQLIMSFQTAALQQMGKLKNVLTDKIERDLQQAQLSIDMLDMIKMKTEANRTEEETSLLDRILRELKLNYIDELEKDQKSVQKDKKTAYTKEQEQKAEEKKQKKRKNKKSNQD